MATPVIMPRQGQSVESCIIGKWHKAKGETVAEGDLLFTYETDKATFDETAKVSGEILEVYFEEGDDVPCLVNVCVIGTKGEDTSSFNPNGAQAQAQSNVETAPATAASTVSATSAAPGEAKAVISTSADANAVIMPRQGQSVESCIIGKWHKQVGDQIAVGDTLFTYETDKATFDETSKFEGELLVKFFEEGDDVPCLMNVCVIGKKGADTTAFDPRGTTAAAVSTVASPASSDNSKNAQNTTIIPATNEKAGMIDRVSLSNINTDDLAISPRAKNLAKKNVVDLRAVAPTGPKGRVIERDIRKLIEEGKFATGAVGTDYALGTTGTGIGGRVSVADLANAPASQTAAAVSAPVIAGPASYEEKHSSIRKLIAKAMNTSLNTMAQLTLNASFDATDIIEFRAKMKKAKESGMADQLGLSLALANPTFNDIILYAVSRVVKNHRLCNAHFYDDKMVFFNTVNLGMAVDTPRGLMVPTIFGADQMSITDISKQAKAVAAACQKGTISPDQLKEGTITITNLGTLGIESFTPVINPPQTCILGVNCLVTAVKNVNGVAVPYQSMGLSLTFDHRALDGAPAARFLKDLKDTLENFSLLLMK